MLEALLVPLFGQFLYELRRIPLPRTPVNKTKRRPESRQLGLDKASGAPFLGKFFAGMDLGFRPDDIEDLSEP